MAGKQAVIDYRKCDPQACERGVCAASLACRLKILTQEEPYEPPVPYPSSCRGCEDCVRTCPLGAVRLVSG
jgi:translation initiation factor RLI1